MFHCGKKRLCLVVVFLFPRCTHGCYASVSMESAHSLYMYPARQTGKQLKFLQRGFHWLFIREELWHRQSRKFGPQGSPALRKIKPTMKLMKYTWRLYLSQLLLLYAWWIQCRAVFWEIMDGCDCFELAEFNMGMGPNRSGCGCSYLIVSEGINFICVH